MQDIAIKRYEEQYGNERYQPYYYDTQRVDAFFHNREQQPDRIGFSVMLEDMVIGDVSLKHIDEENHSCALEICMINDSVKNKGYGTQAEKLAVQYAFEYMNMKDVFADCLMKNTRSQHVLEKVGFQVISESHGFQYYRLTKEMYFQYYGDSVEDTFKNSIAPVLKRIRRWGYLCSCGRIIKKMDDTWDLREGK